MAGKGIISCSPAPQREVIVSPIIGSKGPDGGTIFFYTCQVAITIVGIGNGNAARIDHLRYLVPAVVAINVGLVVYIVINMLGGLGNAVISIVGIGFPGISIIFLQQLVFSVS